MRQDKEEWLKQKIEEDLDALAEERVKLLMEMEELQDIHMPVEKLDDIHREIEARERSRSRLRIRRRAFLVAAAAMVLVVGFGVMSSGSKLYVPEVFRLERGDEVTTKIENTDSLYSEYGNENGEEDVCREIEEKIGVLAPRLAYKPEGMVLSEYQISKKDKEAIMAYKYDEKYIHVYVSKDYSDATINFQTDGEMLDTVIVNSCGLEVPVYKYQSPEEGQYFIASFEYLNTYYFISGMIEQDEFQKILENIFIKNV